MKQVTINYEYGIERRNQYAATTFDFEDKKSMLEWLRTECKSKRKNSRDKEQQNVLPLLGEYKSGVKLVDVASWEISEWDERECVEALNLYGVEKYRILTY